MSDPLRTVQLVVTVVSLLLFVDGAFDFLHLFNAGMDVAATGAFPVAIFTAMVKCGIGLALPVGFSFLLD